MPGESDPNFDKSAANRFNLVAISAQKSESVLSGSKKNSIYKSNSMAAGKGIIVGAGKAVGARYGSNGGG